MRNAAFISCAAEDLAIAQSLESRLDEAALPSWVYTQRLAGSAFPREIAEAITGAGCVIILISPDSADSEWVLKEVHFAKANNVPLLPLMIRRAPSSSPLMFELAGLSWIDATTDGIVDPVFAQITRAVKAHYQRTNPVVAVMNMKGGVGKTTLSANLFGALHKWRAKNVLLIDIDPQYNLTQLLVHQRVHLGMLDQDRSIISAFEPGRPLGKPSPAAVLSNISRIDGDPVDPAHIAHRIDFDAETRARFDLIVGQFEIAKYTLPQNLKRVDDCVNYFQSFVDRARPHYDLVVLDVSPASSHLTLAAMRAATHVLAPVRPDKYSLRGLIAMRRLMDELFTTLPAQPQFLTIMNDVAPDSPTDVERDIRANSEFGPSMLKTIIPHSRYFFARNAGSTTNPADRLAINSSGWHSASLHATLKAAGDELLLRMEDDGPPNTGNDRRTAEVAAQIHS